MTDIRKTWDSVTFSGVIVFRNGDLDGREELETAVLNSLFTWRRALDDDELPEGSGERNGWWGDSFPDVSNDQIGSKLWLLIREKLTQATITRAREYMQESLQWLITDGVASRIDLFLEKSDPFTLATQITIFRKTLEPVVLRYATQWEGITNA